MEEDSFLYFYIFLKQVKSRVLDERAELVASQLTQNYLLLYYLYFCIFFSFAKISGGEECLLRFHYSLTIFYHVTSMLSLLG